jgi:hypothetical protein
MASAKCRDAISRLDLDLAVAAPVRGERDEHHILHLFVEAVWRDDQGRPSL